MNALNDQYNLAAPNSFTDRLGTRVRDGLFHRFMQEFRPGEADEVLDLGVTGDQSYSSSNYFERLYPFKHRVVAAGLDDAKFLEQQYPGMRFEFADACALPFIDKSFDYIHSSAVLEHVGSFQQQSKMVAECVRCARKGIWLTTPNRWFPIEFHTQLPIAHWMPKPAFRALLKKMGQHDLALESNLNLMTSSELGAISRNHPAWKMRVLSSRLLGWKSNLILAGRSVHLSA